MKILVKIWKRWLLVGCCCLFVLLPYCHGQQLDEYGGFTGLKCREATRFFHTEKIDNHWWLCTPLGNAFFSLAVYAVAPGHGHDDRGNDNYDRVSRKYGDPGGKWAEETNKRLKAWGFNTLGLYASDYALPVSSDNRTKVPFMMMIRPGYYSMTNPGILTFRGRHPLLNEPVKGMMYAVSSYYKDWNPPGGVADYFDPKIYEWLKVDLKDEALWGQIRNSRYLSYLIGITSDDSDEMYGFGATNAFPTHPAGHNNAHLGWIIATMSPLQTANPRVQQVYADTLIYTKQAWRDILKAKYVKIETLNAAWHSDYTTFDSSGNPIHDELIGTGDGKQLSFSHTFDHATPSRFSVQVMVNGHVMAGDSGEGGVFGPDLARSTIDYRNGTITINFKPGQAPHAGAKVTMNYVQNGWGIGTGLLDEDGRPSHQAWLGGDFMGLEDTRPGVREDLDNMLRAAAAHYMENCRAVIKSVFPNTLYFGPGLGSWSVPARGPVLEAAAKYMDLMLTGSISNFTPAMLDYVGRYYGDKPILGSVFLSANRDSALNHYSDSNVAGSPTQAARGKAYYDAVQGYLKNPVPSTGSQPFVGVGWWAYYDDWGEKKNWGLVTTLDNAYDGHEDVSAAVPCSPPFSKFGCGGEAGDYGDTLTLVEQANRSWMSYAAKGTKESPKQDHN